MVSLFTSLNQLSVLLLASVAFTKQMAKVISKTKGCFAVLFVWGGEADESPLDDVV